MENPTDNDRLLLNQRICPPFPVWWQQHRFNARATSFLSSAASGAFSPSDWSSQVLFLSNWSLDAMRKQQQQQQPDQVTTAAGPSPQQAWYANAVQVDWSNEASQIVLGNWTSTAWHCYTCIDMFIFSHSWLTLTMLYCRQAIALIGIYWDLRVILCCA